MRGPSEGRVTTETAWTTRHDDRHVVIGGGIAGTSTAWHLGTATDDT